MNKLVLLAIVAAFIAVQAQDEPAQTSQDLNPGMVNMTDFTRWMKDWLPHTKMLPKKWQTIKNHELSERYQNWKNTVKFVYEHNMKTDETWEAGLNMFSHLTDDEFKNINWGFKLPDNSTENSNMPPEDPIAKRQGGKEWKGTAKVKAVRNQGGCGSCWAFSAAGALEGGLSVDVNPQQILDCANLGACGGGDPIAAVRFGQKGVSPMSQYNGGRYDAKGEGCKGLGKMKCSGNPPTVRSGKDADLDKLINGGPVSVCINADGLKNYKSGIASAPCSPGCNHAVLATGYTSSYYHVKNSWGTSFGEQGYFKFAHGQNKCGIAGYCVRPEGCKA